MSERRPLTSAVSKPVPDVDPEIVRSFVTQIPSPESVGSSSKGESAQQSTSSVRTASSKTDFWDGRHRPKLVESDAVTSRCSADEKVAGGRCSQRLAVKDK